MEAHALRSPAVGDGSGESAQSAVAYLVVVRKGPSWDQADLEPYCRLLSRRFVGEVWAFGSYEADAVIGRMRLRVVREHDMRDLANRLRFYLRARAWVRDLRAAHPRGLVFVAPSGEREPRWSQAPRATGRARHSAAPCAATAARRTVRI